MWGGVHPPPHLGSRTYNYQSTSQSAPNPGDLFDILFYFFFKITKKAPKKTRGLGHRLFPPLFRPCPQPPPPSFFSSTRDQNQLFILKRGKKPANQPTGGGRVGLALEQQTYDPDSPVLTPGAAPIDSDDGPPDERAGAALRLPLPLGLRRRAPQGLWPNTRTFGNENK